MNNCTLWVSFSIFLSKSLSVLERDSGRHIERGRGRESARACVRAAFGALGICAHRNTARAQEALSLPTFSHLLDCQ